MLQKMSRGYLESDFRVFHMNDVPHSDILMHYHDFRKIMVLLNGSMRCLMEDQTYSMDAGDVMLVETGSMHRPIFQEGKTYERAIIYLSDSYFAARPGLDELFLRAEEHRDFLLKVTPRESERVIGMTRALSDRACSHSRFPLLLQQSRLNELLIELNDIAAGNDREEALLSDDGKSVQEAIRYIYGHLTEDLCAKKIAGVLGLSESCLNQQFKKETGLTLRTFVAEKRLCTSFLNLKNGCSAADACAMSGFASYSSFYRAFMDRYGTSPKNFETTQELDEQEPEE